MQTDNPFIDDLSKMAQSLMSTLNAAKEECDAMIRARIERLATQFKLVPQDDFEALKEIVLKLRLENEDLKLRLAKLEDHLRSDSKK